MKTIFKTSSEAVNSLKNLPHLGFAKSARLPDAVRFAASRQGSVYKYVTADGAEAKRTWRAKANENDFQNFERSCKFLEKSFSFSFAALALLAHQPPESDFLTRAV
nr:MAG TPA: hypothetical protein [Caudoviricetes sp.]